MQPGRSPLPPLPTRPPAGEGTHLAGSGCTGFSLPPGANPAGCFMGRTSTLPRGEQREGRVCSAGRGHPAQGHLLPLLRAAQQALTRADPTASRDPPAARPPRQAQAPRGWALQPFSQKGRPAAEPCGPRSPRAGNLRLLSRGCATAGLPVQVRASAVVDPADNMGRWLATRGPAAAGSRGSPPPEGARVAQGTGNTPGRQARDTGSTGTDSRAASAGRGRARGLRNASHTATRERAGTVALGQGPRTSEPLACGCTLPSAPRRPAAP